MADDSTKNYIPQIIPDPRKLQAKLARMKKKRVFGFIGVRSIVYTSVKNRHNWCLQGD